MMKMALQCIRLVLLVLPALSLSAKVSILTKTGALVGKTEIYNGTLYYSFRGIPYAEPPVGELRFKPPIPKSPWSGILNAENYGYVCPQETTSYPADRQSENCLFLNIFVPKIKTAAPLPVLFYVYGGYFRSGAGENLGPELLLQNSSFILITMNHRLGALGFLNLNLPEASGNAGLKDVLLAFKRVHENIEYFNGDPNRITIGGHSSGSTLAYYLTILPQLEGMITGGIFQSGSPINYRHRMLQPLKTAFELASALNIDTNDTKVLLDEFRNQNPMDLVNAIATMGDSDVRKGIATYVPFLPSVEIDIPGALVTKSIEEMIEDKHNGNIPILMGYTSQESLNFVKIAEENRTLIDLLNEDFQRCTPLDLQLFFIDSESKSMYLANEMKEFYFRGENISLENWQAYVNFLSDMNYAHSIDYTVRIHKKSRNSSKIYYYYFNYDGELNFSKKTNNLTIPGAMHGDDLGYIFNFGLTDSILSNANTQTKHMIDIFHKVMENFVNHGNPTPEASGLDFTWDELYYPELNQLILNTDPQMLENGPVRGRMEFWDSFYNQYYARCL